jgi:hypothetical protein
MNDGGEIVGMVDVLKLTYATLDQINSMSTGENEGPAWNKFWLSLDNEDTESAISASERGGRLAHTADARSLMSPEHMRPELIERVDSVMPGESASHHGDDDDSISAVAPVPVIPTLEDAPFAFKFKAPSGRVHRIQVIPSSGMEALVTDVSAKLGAEVDSVGGEPSVAEGRLGKTGFALSYLDNEGDTVSITTNHDLIEAITLARQNRRDKVDLFVHDPEQAPIPATLDPPPGPLPPPTPADSVVISRKGRRAVEEEETEESEEEEVSKMSKKKKQVAAPAIAEAKTVGGVPEGVLLPAAIAGLAIVIVGVFAFGRSTAK